MKSQMFELYWYCTNTTSHVPIVSYGKIWLQDCRQTTPRLWLSVQKPYPGVCLAVGMVWLVHRTCLMLHLCIWG